MIEEIREKTYAVIVAVENYQFGIPKVEYAKNDASEFRNWLINDLKVPNENIKLWFDSDVTRSALTEELQYDISRLSENDKFIFYYAGHGFFDGGSNKITTWDTHQNNLRETTVSLNCILMESLRKSKCDKSLIFIDACASKIGEQLSSRELLIGMNTNEFINFVHSGKYRGMFLSCSREEKSYSSSVLEHGIWTYFLLKALRGEAPEAIIKERFVTNTSLQNYLSKAVPDFIKNETDITGVQNPWAEVASSNEFTVCEIFKENSGIDIEYIFIPERLMLDINNDLIIAPLSGLENDGRRYPMFDSEGLKEFDVEAFCIRISRVKSEIKGLLEEIIDFLMEYEWKEEVSFEKDDDKFMICANLYEDRENETITISLCLLLRISGFHPMGDIIFESEFNVEENELTISTENSDFNLDEEEIQIIFSDCWDEIRQYLLIEKEILEEIWEDE